ncbi:MAG: LysE family translocator [Pseudomonadota bacterium]
MIDPITLLTFVPAALALNLTPGSDMMFSLGQGLKSGSRAAVAASAGISTGGMVHVVLAGVGLGAVVSAVPWLFDAIRWIGVTYLFWLAWSALRAGPQAPHGQPVTATRSFLGGLTVNLTNPKVILFVLAFIPQFVDPAAGPILPQFLIFGAVIAVGGFLVNAAVGVFAGRAGRHLVGNPRTRHALGWLSAGIFAALALRLAIMERT